MATTHPAKNHKRHTLPHRYDMKNVGLYIHIPFCKSRCLYCGFYSTTFHDIRQRYTDALLAEMEMRRDELAPLYGHSAPLPADTLYLGGGTPSALDIHDVSRIVQKARDITCRSLEEVTMEVNPDDVTAEMATAIADMGINRVSMGIQTFDDKRLRFLRRRHTAAQAMEAVGTLRRCGVKSISVDLMFGFPQQTAQEWQNDIDTALSLAPEHISAYSLMYEEGTPLHAMLQEGRVKQLGDEACLDMYNALADSLTSHGYEHYEISNFAKPRHRAMHNSKYWNDTPYLGFGAAAHSYSIDKRSWNIADIHKYISSIANGQLPSEHELIDETTHYNDLVTTAMRTREGLCLDMLTPSQRQTALDNAAPHLENGLLQLSGSHLALTRKGLFVSDMVMSDMMIV